MYFIWHICSLHAGVSTQRLSTFNSTSLRVHILFTLAPLPPVTLQITLLKLMSPCVFSESSFCGTYEHLTRMQSVKLVCLFPLHWSPAMLCLQLSLTVVLFWLCPNVRRNTAKCPLGCPWGRKNMMRHLLGCLSSDQNMIKLPFQCTKCAKVPSRVQTR